MNILAINTGGIGDLHGLRVRRLTADLPYDVTVYDVDRSRGRWQNLHHIDKVLRSKHWDLVYQEATGVVAGLNLIRAAKSRAQQFIVSSGDPVEGYFRNVKGPVAGWIATRYERSLYRNCTCFIGWTPYLTGRAIHMGAPRGATIEGAVDTSLFAPRSEEERTAIRRKLGIPGSNIVCGVVGSIRWVPRQQYCYGLELVRMLDYLERTDVSVLIVGDGDGMPRLRAGADRHPGRVVFTGRVPEEDVATAVNAMDIGFITQTLDGLGSFRLTTKMPEYLASGVPIAVSPIPGLFDYAWEAGWALPAFHPASDEMPRGIAQWLDRITRDEVRARASRARAVAVSRFDYDIVAPRFAGLLRHLLGA